MTVTTVQTTTAPFGYKKDEKDHIVIDEATAPVVELIFSIAEEVHDPVHAGNLIVEERPTKTMRSKKRQYIPFAEREVIYGTHEPIIEQNRRNNVQKILQSRPPVIGETSSG